MADHRTVLNGMFWVLNAGAQWRDMPERYGKWETVDGRIDWSVFDVDGSIVRAHRSAAGASKINRPDEPADHALGRSRGGFGTKLHLVTDGYGVLVTAGQSHESKSFAALMNMVSIGRRHRPRAVAGDKRYSYRPARQWLAERGIKAVIPTRSDQRRLTLDRATYRRRNVVERCIGWLKECRRVATRYEKLATHYLAFLKLAMIQRCLRILDPSNRT